MSEDRRHVDDRATARREHGGPGEFVADRHTGDRAHGAGFGNENVGATKLRAAPMSAQTRRASSVTSAEHRSGTGWPQAPPHSRRLAPALRPAGSGQVRTAQDTIRPYLAGVRH